MKDYYSILGVEKSASEQDIKKAYRTLSKKHHPDICKDSDAEDKFKDIAEAYEIIGNKDKRSQYDRGGSSFGGFGFDDIFSSGNSNNDFFNSFFGGQRGHRPTHDNKKGKDIKIKLGITLDQVDTGDKITIKYKKNIKCEDCKGVGGVDKTTCTVCNGAGIRTERIRTQLGYMENQSICYNCGGEGHVVKDKCKTCNGKAYKQSEENLNITIPRGVSQGISFKYNGKGNEGERTPGDLIIEFVINEHRYFRRQNLNLIYDLKVPFNILIIGGKVEVPGLNAKKYSIDIPKMSKPGYNLRLKGRGLSKSQSDIKGDMIIVLDLEYPNDINEDEIKIISELNNKPNFIYNNKTI